MDIEIINEPGDVVEILKKVKLDYDKARMELIDYKLDDLIAEYGKLKELGDEIQEKFFSVIESIKENELDDVCSSSVFVN